LATQGSPPGATPVAGQAEEMPLVGGWIMEAPLSSCTTCRACMEACPVFIEHVPKITDMRRYLVMQESRFPPELARLFRNLETKGNPWDFRPNQRADWAEGLDVPELADMAAQAESEGRPLFAAPKSKIQDPQSEGPLLEVLHWVGRQDSFD